ncbi:MAG TPA: hypothetical protein VK249_09135 [Anaerolineales bacterium]|nr:hypothetical protein [Anaerolineales bacterium]
MTPQVRAFARAALWALPVWAAMLFLGTLTHQPDPQKDFAGFAAYVTTTSFLFSHLINSITGAAIGSIGIVGLMLYLQDSKVVGRTIAGMVALVASNTIVSSIFGVAAFAQTAMGRMFMAGQQNALDFYNQVYNGALFGTALIALLLFMLGGVLIGNALTTSDLFPRWTGWIFAISMVGFVLSNFLLDIGQSIFSALLFLVTVTVAWNAGKEGQMQAAKPAVSLEP